MRNSRTSGRTTGRTTGRNKPTSRRPSVHGELKSSFAKKKAANKVKNPKARKALSKRHPKTPIPRRGTINLDPNAPDRARFY